MKKIYLSFFLLSFLAFSFSYGQIGKGSLLLGGRLGLSNDFAPENDILIAGVKPEFGFFLSDKFVLGGRLGIDYYKEGDLNAGGLSLAPMLRYYLKNGESPWKWFSEARFSMNFGYGDLNENTVYALAAGLGGNLFLNSEVALEGILQYLDTDLGNSGRNSGLVFNLGLQFFLSPDSEKENGALSILKSGRMFIGGSTANLDMSDLVNDRSGFGFGLNPNVGLFLSEKWALGSSLFISHSSNDFYNGYSFGVSPFARFYPQASDGPLQWFLTAGVGITRMVNEFDEIVGNPMELNNSQWLKSFNTGIGLDWFLSENIAVEGILGYTYIDAPAFSSETRNLGFNIGFQYFLRAKK